MASSRNIWNQGYPGGFTLIRMSLKSILGFETEEKNVGWFITSQGEIENVRLEEFYVVSNHDTLDPSPLEWPKVRTSTSNV
jgi:hypothetical protein